MKVFISSTYRDLTDDRWSLLTSLKKAGFDSWGMEFFAAIPDKPKKVCLEEVRKSNLIILIIGEHYGTVDQETGKSLTHLEYERGSENHIPILSFIKSNSSSNDERLLKFRIQVETGGQTVGYFTDPYIPTHCQDKK